MSRRNKPHPMEQDRIRVKRELESAYAKGFRASHAGETILANPFFDDRGIESLQRWKHWRQGFKTAEWQQ